MVSDVRLKYLIDNTPAIIFSSVPTGDCCWTYVSANPLNVLGYTPERVVADANFWFDHVPPMTAGRSFPAWR